MELTNRYPSFDTVTESLVWLKEEGYTHNFNFKDDAIISLEGGHSFSPDDFYIDYVFRFEGDSDPSDEDIVYGISSEKFEAKGVLTSAFGADADSLANDLISRLVISRPE